MIPIILFILFMVVFAYAVCWVAGEADAAKVRFRCRCGSRTGGKGIVPDPDDLKRHTETLCEDCPNCRAIAKRERAARIRAAMQTQGCKPANQSRDREGADTLRDREAMSV